MMNFLNAIGRWARYAYFLRFALILWFFAPAFCFLNIKDQTLSSGILVSEFWEQYFCVAFFLVSASLAALITARIVLINGPARWGESYEAAADNRPPFLTTLLVNDEGRYELAAVILSQIPNFLVFPYLIWFGATEGVVLWKILVGLAVGAVLAFFFWWLANCWYYLTFKAADFTPQPTTFILGRNAARTILYPRRFFFLNAPGDDCPGKPTLEQAKTILSDNKWSGLQKLKGMIAGFQGYGSITGDRVQFYEAHTFATIALVVFIALYLLIWPLTAPVPVKIVSWVAIAALFLAIAILLGIFWTAQPPTTADGQQGSLRRIQVILTLAMAGFFIAVVSLRLFTSAERFPILATVLILIIALCWLLGGVAFFLDRYRVPVLTLMLLSMVVLRMLPNHGEEEHYISVITGAQNSQVPTPAQVLASRLNNAGGQPLIIVTATGGGLHASAWTATVLAQLEKEFGPDFHNHLLLASTVSGGSVGLLAYLRELQEGTLDTDPQVAAARMQSVAQCSSLESVGWGLVYFDLPKAFVPVLPYFVPPSSGNDDLDPGGTPLFKDRTWSLRKSFERNLSNKYCDAIWTRDTGLAPTWTRDKDARPGSALTLRAFLNTDHFPAITMNTTTVENGERFLLANYKIPPINLDAGPNYRARSFLETFKTGARGVTDLPLATAAQLSATFPAVSSSARVPLSLDNDPSSVHFADGGYYDNDGTASAIEFLRYALNDPSSPPKIAPVRILLIEIRNSGDISGSGPESNPDRGQGKSPWNLFSQAGAPLLGFWQAGHESITARDQSGLEVLEKSLTGKLKVHPVVFADICSTVFAGTDPLNWSLTPRQRAEVRESAGQLQPRVQEAKDWFTKSSSDWDNAEAVKTVQPQTAMTCTAHPGGK
jgi:hypothetical protein